MSSSVLAIENLSVDYFRKGKTVHAVRNFSLTVNPGETVGLVGESGSGKSTVAQAVLRLIRPQEGRIVSGRILLHGQDLLSVSEKVIQSVRGRRIGMIFQDPFTSLNPVMRIREQMLEMGGINPQQAEEALVRVQLDPLRVMQAYPHQLSGGQRQRVMIAMALLLKPDLILADEPTTALDVLVQKDILELLFRLQKELKMAILFISHNLGLVATYTSKVAVMSEGRIVEEGLSHDTFQSPQHPYTRALLSALPPLVRGHLP